MSTSPGKTKTKNPLLYFWPVSAMLSTYVQSHFTLSLRPACNTASLHGRAWEIADLAARTCTCTCMSGVHTSPRQLKGDRNCAGFIWRIGFMLIGCKRKPLCHRIPLCSETIFIFTFLSIFIITSIFCSPSPLTSASGTF